MHNFACVLGQKMLSTSKYKEPAVKYRLKVNWDFKHYHWSKGNLKSLAANIKRKIFPEAISGSFVFPY